ncbi:peptidoglycan DD-metalloendopeptidase family protein [Flavicella sediminum]|uniref:peptidoglycan DD-metalloendopeptidase family protein n=1 Tax=Flavicella sediminum TaxID=2585141 RepID=UPI00112157E1|nr:peptidoglycan DD-metalloendopeptidase family protein [Flavicella sediminum]
MKHFLILVSLVFFISSCGGGNNDKKPEKQKEEVKPVVPKPVYKFGYKLKDFKVVKDTVEHGESFGEILDRHHIWYPKVLEISKKVKGIFDVRRIRAGKPYMVLASKDSTERAQVFIYQHDLINYTVIDFKDSLIVAEKIQKPIKIVEKTASGVITSSLSEALDQQGINAVLANDLSEIYAWAIDFFRLQKNDKFKVIYEQKYIDDTISAGIGRVKAAYFEHGGSPFYAFKYVSDSITGIEEYYDENAKHLRRAFLKAPLKFSRISSRYNLKRKIAYYGRVRPHKGTDFAAPVGSPIMSTANGRVIESRYKGGNGNYVKIRHNSTYSTQYLHMKSRKVKVGQYVKQGDVIGYVGMTGNTSGPHVCYRFWKNGVQVDPLKQKLPAAEAMKKTIKPHYLTHIKSIKESLDQIGYENVEVTN